MAIGSLSSPSLKTEEQLWTSVTSLIWSLLYGPAAQYKQEVMLTQCSPSTSLMFTYEVLARMTTVQLLKECPAHSLDYLDGLPLVYLTREISLIGGRRGHGMALTWVAHEVQSISVCFGLLRRRPLQQSPILWLHQARHGSLSVLHQKWSSQHAMSSVHPFTRNLLYLGGG